jgi:TolB-like protein/tetratricopeptide (TPR) repeat protein
MFGAEQYQFGSFVLDASEQRLTRQNQSIRLKPKTFEVLLVLIRNAGRLVKKSELLHLVWPEAFVEEGILAVHISALRKILDTDSAESYIETIPRAGYRFRVAVTRPAISRTPQAGHRSLQFESTRIAVLPFTNIGGATEDEYFSDGLSEEVINALTRTPGMKVIARTSAFAFKKADTDVRRIAETLGVGRVLEGSVRRSGRRIRVTARLIDASDGAHLWSGRFDRELHDIFALQDDITQEIISALPIADPARPSIRQCTPSFPAWEAYLKGLYEHRKFTPVSLAAGQKHFEQAIALDPCFAEARIALGRLLFELVLAGFSAAADGMPCVRKAAQDAIACDTNLPDAHALAGLVAATWDYDWEEAERCFRAALRSELVSPWVHASHGVYLTASGRTADGIAALTRALEQDPLDFVSRANLAASLDLAGQTDDGFAHLRRIAEFDENFWAAWFFMGVFHGLRGRHADALPFAEKAYKLAPWYPGVVGFLAGLLTRTGNCLRAAEALARLRSSTSDGSAIGWSVYHLACGDIEKAAECLAQAIEQRHPRAIVLLTGPGRRLFAASKEWARLARAMKLPEAPDISADC